MHNQSSKSSYPEEEKFTFKAIPMPNFSVTCLPKKPELELTEPEPFQLTTDQRGALATLLLQQKLEREQRELEEKRKFKAQPLPDHEPFVNK